MIINKRILKRLSIVLVTGILTLAPVAVRSQSLLDAPLPNGIVIQPEKVETKTKPLEMTSVCMKIADFSKYLEENEATALFHGKLQTLPSKSFNLKTIKQTNVEIYYPEKHKTIFNVMYNRTTNQACVSVAVKDVELNEHNYRVIGRQAYGYGKEDSIEEQN